MSDYSGNRVPHPPPPPPLPGYPQPQPQPDGAYGHATAPPPPPPQVPPSKTYAGFGAQNAASSGDGATGGEISEQGQTAPNPPSCNTTNERVSEGMNERVNESQNQTPPNYPTAPGAAYEHLPPPPGYAPYPPPPPYGYAYSGPPPPPPSYPPNHPPPPGPPGPPAQTSVPVVPAPAGYPGSSTPVSGGKKPFPWWMAFLIGLAAGFILNILGYIVICCIPKKFKAGRRQAALSCGVTLGWILQLGLLALIFFVFLGRHFNIPLPF